MTAATGSNENVHKVADLMRGQRFGMLTTVAADGTLTSRPMALQEIEFDGNLWFFAERGSRKMGHIDAHPQVNVTVGSGSTWVSLTGAAAAIDDEKKKKELWNAGVAAWFPDGPDAPRSSWSRSRAGLAAAGLQT